MIPISVERLRYVDATWFAEKWRTSTHPFYSSPVVITVVMGYQDWSSTTIKTIDDL